MAIAEPDMLAEIRRRLAALDLDALRQGAVERFWQRTAMDYLPPARTARVRDIDPAIELQADIRDADGQVLFPAGTRFNPFDHAAFTLRLIIFDATDPAQIAIAKAAAAHADDRQPMFITTRLDRVGGWEAFATLEDTLDAPVYLLTPELRTRFALEAVPSIIEAQDRRFRVTEVRVDGR